MPLFGCDCEHRTRLPPFPPYLKSRRAGSATTLALLLLAAHVILTRAFVQPPSPARPPPAFPLVHDLIAGAWDKERLVVMIDAFAWKSTAWLVFWTLSLSSSPPFFWFLFPPVLFSRNNKNSTRQPQTKTSLSRFPLPPTHALPDTILIHTVTLFFVVRQKKTKSERASERERGDAHSPSSVFYSRGGAAAAAAATRGGWRRRPRSSSSSSSNRRAVSSKQAPHHNSFGN